MRDDERERLELLTVEAILHVRKAYLAAGANPLKHWDQIQDRVRMAARTSTTVGEWVTRVSRSLGLGAPNNYRSSSVAALERAVKDTCRADEWLDLVEDEHAYLMAMARLEAERRKRRPETAETEEEALERAIGGPVETVQS